MQLSVSASQHSVQLVVRLGRKSQLYQCLVVGPVVLLALLVPCIFLLPADSTAKITLGTSCASGSTVVRLVLSSDSTVNIALGTSWAGVGWV